MAKKLPDAAAARLFTNVFVCMHCNAKIRSRLEAVKKGKVKCRKCGYKVLRLKAKERRGQKTG
jgi:ribosomal protein L40E